MMEEKEKGIFSRLFGKGSSTCCKVRIEELPEEDEKESKKQGAADRNKADRVHRDGQNGP